MCSSDLINAAFMHIAHEPANDVSSVLSMFKKPPYANTTLLIKTKYVLIEMKNYPTTCMYIVVS